MQELPDVIKIKKILQKSNDFNTLESFTGYTPVISNPFTYNSINLHEKPTIDCVKKCPECEYSEMYRKNNGTAFVCYKCGLMENIVGDEIEPKKSSNNNNYNTADQSAPLRVVGTGSQHYQKAFLSKISDYKKTQLRDTVKQLQNILYQNGGKSISHSIIYDTAQMYRKIQQHAIKRGDVRKGALAACLNMVCQEAGIIKKPKEFSDMFGIDQSDFSGGEKILNDLKNSGVIISKKSTPIELFLARFFESLSIPETGLRNINNSEDHDENNKKEEVNYMEFSKLLIRFANKFKIAEHSIPSSQCAGVIYILSLKCGELCLSKDEIQEKCSVSKSTFKRFAKDISLFLENRDEKKKILRRKLRHLFNKFNIPL